MVYNSKDDARNFNQKLTIERIEDLSKNMFKYLKKLITDLEEFEQDGMKEKRKEIMDEYFNFTKNNYLHSIEHNLKMLKEFLDDVQKEKNSTN